MPRIISANRTVIFDDECGEYVFLKAVEADNQGLAIHIETIVDDVDLVDEDERATAIGDEIHQAVRELADDEILYTGTAHRLVTGFLANLDWYQIGLYYLERHETKGAGQHERPGR